MPSTPGDALRNNLTKLQEEDLNISGCGLGWSLELPPPPFKSTRMSLEIMSIWGILERWTHLPHSIVLPEAFEWRSYGAWS